MMSECECPGSHAFCGIPSRPHLQWLQTARHEHLCGRYTIPAQLRLCSLGRSQATQYEAVISPKSSETDKSCTKNVMLGKLYGRQTHLE